MHRNILNQELYDFKITSDKDKNLKQIHMMIEDINLKANQEFDATDDARFKMVL